MSGRPVLWLLPGLLCDAYVWREQEVAFNASHEVHLADFRGFSSITEMARSVLEQSDVPFALAGHSMGGRVAMEMVRLAPQRVSRLMLLDTGYKPSAPGEEEKRMALVELARREGMAALAAVWLPPMVHPERMNDPTLMDPLVQMVCRADPDTFEGQQRALLDRPDAGPGLGDIRCPTWLVCGSDDGWSPLAQHREIQALIAGSEMTVIEGSGHMTTVERPQAVTAAMRRWLGV
jgi:pimeloyl-ACP methyl ester carboxylesterase